MHYSRIRSAAARSRLVLEQWCEYSRNHGHILPKLFRTDKGHETVLLRSFALTLGANFCRGKSIHNTRVERMFGCVAVVHRQPTRLFHSPGVPPAPSRRRFVNMVSNKYKMVRPPIFTRARTLRCTLRCLLTAALLLARARVQTFEAMELHGILRVDDPVHLCSLRYAFMRQINRDLQGLTCRHLAAPFV